LQPDGLCKLAADSSEPTGNLNPGLLLTMAKSTASPKQPYLAASSKIVGISSTPTKDGPPADYEPLIEAGEASKFLGFKPITIKRMAQKGLLPTIPFPIGKTGKYRYKFKLSKLEAYVESLSRPALAA
jgi:hypothetical protein